MSGLLGLTNKIIVAITNNDNIRSATRAELRNFLNGRITTVTDEGEFTATLRELVKDIKSGMPETPVAGEILGALEGGAVVGIAGGALIAGKGLEIANELSDLLDHSEPETIARQRLRDQIQSDRARGVIHGAMGRPSREISDLIRQQQEQWDSYGDESKHPDEGESKRDFSMPDPSSRQTVTDSSSSSSHVIDIADEDEDEGNVSTGAKIVGGLVAGAAAGAGLIGDLTGAGDGTPLIKLKPVPDPIPPGGSSTLPQKPESGGGSGGGSGGESTDSATLRASFLMTGTDYFASKVPLAVENSEWAEFDFVGLDRTNGIEMDNVVSDRVRFMEPMFSAIYVPPPKPPIQASVWLSQIPMEREIQLTQRFVDKFDDRGIESSLGKSMDFTDPYNRSVFDSGFSRLELYNPI